MHARVRFESAPATRGLLIALALAKTAGCGGDGTMRDSDAAASENDGGALTLSVIQDEILVPSCVLGRCHTTRDPAGDLSFTGRRVPVYDELVDAPSSQAPDQIRVVPGDPGASYLMEKLTDPEPAAGTPMPPFGPLEDAKIARIRAWISAGAPR